LIKGSHHTESAKKLLSKGVRRAHRLGLMNKESQFKKSYKPWNKGVPMHLSPMTEFKTGITTMQNHPSWKGGINIPKKDVVSIRIASKVLKRRPRLIWEKYHGRKIPKGCVIYHKNGDNHDDRPENLICISRKELYRINLMKGRWGY
jgi:hypothetical protein